MKVVINVEIYSIKVVLVTTFEEFKKLHKKANPQSQFITTEYGSEIYVLVSDIWESMYDHRFMQCLAHELNHAAMCILGVSGVRFDYQNQEALCYLQDFMVAKVMKAINKKASN